MSLKEAVEHSEIVLDEITFQREENLRLKDELDAMRIRAETAEANVAVLSLSLKHSEQNAKDRKGQVDDLRSLVAEYRKEAARLHGLLTSNGVNPRTGLREP